jgi:hypothetical protein
VLFLRDFYGDLKSSAFGQICLIQLGAVVSPQLHTFAHDEKLLLKIWARFTSVNVQAQRYPIAHVDFAVFLRDQKRSRLFTGHSQRNFHTIIVYPLPPNQTN